MSIRVLHIFSPNFQTRFGGTTFRWRGYFSAWSEEQISHFVLETKSRKLIKANEAFTFAYAKKQSRLSRIKRLTWILVLIFCLNKFKSQYDILHVHVLWWGGLLLAYWAKKKGIPAMYECVLEDSDTPSVIKNEKFGKLKLWLLRKYSAILAISEPLAQDYLNSGFDDSRVFVLSNCLNSETFRPPASQDEKISLRQKYGFNLESIVLLFVGSLIERKGFDILVYAFVKLTKHHKNLVLCVVGPRNKAENPSLDEDYIGKNLDILSQDGLSDRVQLMGLIQDRDLLAEIYRTADLFVFPSRREGLPNVVLEAMASGLPVVVSDLPGLRNVVSPTINGLVIPIGEVEPLVNAIDSLLNDPILASQLGNNAHETILQNHSFSSWQSQLSNIYHILLRERV